MPRRFLPLLGQWTGLEKREESPAAPAATARASFVFKLDVAATVVVQDYRQVLADGSEFLGHGVFLAEPSTDRLLWWFFDTSGLPPVPARGGWIGAELVLERSTEHGRAQHRFRAADDRLDYRVLLELRNPGVWTPFLTGTYSRVSGH